MARDVNSVRVTPIRQRDIVPDEVSPQCVADTIRLETARPEVVAAARSTAEEEAEVLKGSLKAGSIAQIVVALIAVMGFLYLLKFVMVTLLFALLLAFALEPFVNQLSLIAVPRAIGALVAIVLASGLVGGLGYFLYGRLGDFASELPRYSERIGRSVSRIQEPLHKIEKTTSSIASYPKDGPVPVTVQEAPSFSRTFATSGGEIGEVLLAVGFIPFLTYFMLTWKEHAHTATVQLFAEEHRAIAYRTIAKISAMIRSFIVGILTVGVIGAAVCSLAFWAVGIPYSYFLGIISGFVSVIPSFGVLLALVPPLAGGIGILSKTGLIVVFLTVVGTHAITMNLLYPKFIGNRVRLNPLVVLLSLLFWAWIWGAAGLILAVPIMGAAKIICDYTESLKGFGAWLGH